MQEHLHQPRLRKQIQIKESLGPQTTFQINSKILENYPVYNEKLALAKSWITFFVDRSVCDDKLELNQYIIQIAVASCDFLDSTRKVGIVKENWPWHNRWEGDQLVAVAPGGGESREVAATAALQGCPNRRIHRQSTHTAPEDSSLGTHASMQTLSALALLWDSRGATHGFIQLESSYALSPTTKQIQNIHTMRLRLNICAGFTSFSTYYMTIRTW